MSDRTTKVIAHTPGPWKATLHFGEWSVRQDPKDWDGMGYQFIAGLPSARKKTHYGEMFAANARLIAAAPDLLEALQKIVSEGDFTAPEGMKAIARAAIKRAFSMTSIPTDTRSLKPCPFCGRPDQVRLQQQNLYEKDARGVAVLTPAGFAALDRYHEMTDKIEELIAEIDRLKGLSPEPGVQQVPLSELQEALTSEGAKDYRIAVLEQALDWAMEAVVAAYDEGECPKAIFEELEASRARIIAAGSAVTKAEQ